MKGTRMAEPCQIKDDRRESRFATSECSVKKQGMSHVSYKLEIELKLKEEAEPTSRHVKPFSPQLFPQTQGVFQAQDL